MAISTRWSEQSRPRKAIYEYKQASSLGFFELAIARACSTADHLGCDTPNPRPKQSSLPSEAQFCPEFERRVTSLLSACPAASYIYSGISQFSSMHIASPHGGAFTGRANLRASLPRTPFGQRSAKAASWYLQVLSCPCRHCIDDARGRSSRFKCLKGGTLTLTR